MAHEMIRLYGCLQLSIAWIVLSSCDITDGRLLRRISEAFSAGYFLQAVVMARAQFTNPSGHRFEHWILALLSLAIAILYAVIRFVKKLKDFELPYRDT